MSSIAERHRAPALAARICGSVPLGTAARTLHLGTVLVALGGGLAAAVTGEVDSSDWLTFAAVASAAGLTQVWTVPTGRNHGFQTALAFVVAAVLLLPPALIVLVAVVQHVPDWILRRRPWYIEVFNIANVAVNGLAAWGAAELVRDLPSHHPELAFAAAGLAACATFVAANHLLLAWMLLLARGHGLREGGLLSPRSLGIDLVVAAVGLALAGFWEVNPWLLPAVLAPLLLSQRSFSGLAALTESEERFRTMFASAPIGTALLDLEGRIVTTNDAFARMLDREPGELVGVGLDEVTVEEDAGESAAIVRGLAAGAHGRHEAEHRYRARGDRVVWGRLVASTVRDPDGRPKYALVMTEDVTERKELEDQLRHAQKMEAVGRLAGGVAHDFNNLLTAIAGYAEMAMRRAEPGQEALRDAVRNISLSADRAGALTRQLLAFSRKQILQPQVLRPSDLVGEMDGILRRLIGTDVEIATRHGRGLGHVRADPGQLSQVLVNLVVNARDAMPEGGLLTIETANVDVDEPAARSAGVEAGRYVALTVADTGEGMDAATKARIFEPFFTTKEAGKGTGLGLATTYGIVQQSGGFITVDSAPGEGALFRVFLPRVEPEDDAPAGEEEAPEAPRGSETVLLVEDEEVVRRLVAEMLGTAGYRVLQAADAGEALATAAAHEGPIDLLLTDVVMPRTGGAELAERLLAQRPETRVLYTSGHTDEGIVERGVLRPGTEFIQKPFSVVELATKVRGVLDA